MAEVRRAAALDGMRRRGPDMGGEWSDAGAWLGHRRLSIVDLSAAGAQPMSTADGRAHLVCNGEIYNSPELRAELEALGQRFSSHSDNEVILHGYVVWGEAVIERLVGMFAFVLWDQTKRTLLAARDRIGIKPLYWARCGDGIVLGSEAGVVRSLLPAPPAPSPKALAYVMTLGYVPSPESIWTGINKLEAGHRLTWTEQDGVHITRYWEPPRDIDLSKSREDWNELFGRVVDQHLLADVDIGLFLSGGIDSSAIAAQLALRHASVEAITLDYADHPQSEAAIAGACAAHLGLRHRRVPLADGDVISLARDAAAAFDEPQGYSALLSMLRISDSARALGYKVILSGDGGDEVFAGYSWYKDLDFRWRPASGLRRFLSRDRTRSLKDFAGLSLLHRHAMRLFPRFLPEEAASLMAPCGLAFDDDAMLAPLERHFESRLPTRRALQRVDLGTFCADSILAKVDRASMRHSLEVRVPLLDHRVVEWGLTQPEDGGAPKSTLRSYLAGRVPDTVLSHPKQGFSLRTKAFDYTQLIPRIREGIWVRNGYWISDWEKLVAPSAAYRDARIWTLFMLTEWGNRHWS